MIGRVMVVVLVATLSAGVLSPAFGYSAEVRERMIVRNLASTPLDDSVRPVVARDSQPGTGSFSRSSGPTGFGWPLIAAGPDSAPYNIALLDSGGHLLSRSRMATWSVWDSMFDLAGSGNQPMLETHNIASSPVSNKVCITWVRTDTSPMPGYYRISSDGGASWDSVKQLDWPSAYGGDTVASFHVSSLYPFYDSRDRLNVVAAVHPIVHDTGFIMPAGIWYWCPNDSPSWKQIRRAGCDPANLAAPVGYNALYACRPCGCCIAGDFFLLAWEQFDSANVDPRTNLLRAGIHLCAFEDGGAYFETLRMTDPGPYSCRFPAVAADSIISDSISVLYEVDQVAGFSPLSQGPCTHNPVLCRQLYITDQMRLGELDTIGGTTYDLQTCGPARAVIRRVPGYGVHAAWMWSDDTTGAFPGLRVRYNFYDCWNHLWYWTDPDFMQSGVNVFPYSAGLGCIDVDHATGVAVVSACAPPPLPQVAVEESQKSRAPRPRPTATIARGVVYVPEAASRRPQAVSLLDISGREVLGLHPGANNVRALAPGVYFVRIAQAQAQTQAVKKVVLTR